MKLDFEFAAQKRQRDLDLKRQCPYGHASTPSHKTKPMERTLVQSKLVAKSAARLCKRGEDLRWRLPS